jgi:hypothetical protein
MKEFLEKNSRKLLVVGGIFLGVSFFIFQISETKKRINNENFIIFPGDKIEKILRGNSEKRESIYNIHDEKKEEINEKLIIEAELIEELQKEINNEENGAEKE